MSERGLLAPMWAATAMATSDEVCLAAMLEAALARAGARIGLVPDGHRATGVGVCGSDRRCRYSSDTGK